MDTADLFTRLAVALGVGLLIGLERGWTRRSDAAGSRTAGVRTFTISGLLGGVLGALALSEGLQGTGGIVPGLGFAAFAVVLAFFAHEENKASGSFSATTAIAGMITCALGMYAVLGDMRVAGAGAVAVAGLLALREGLHSLVKSITWEEMRSGLMLLAMSVIALPLLPDEDLGPFGGINPREIWLIAIVLATVSFCGYLAVKLVGQTRGTLVSAAAGGLVSSTAIMVNHARRAAAGEGDPRLLAAGATLATAVSLARTLAVVAAINRSVFLAVVVPLAAATLAMVAAALVLALRPVNGGKQKRHETLRNPFELRVVFGFALMLALLEMLAMFLAGRFGGSGALYAAVIAGAGDVDAATVSVTRLAGGSISVPQAALAVLAAVASNNTAKLGFGIAAGGRQFGLWAGAGVLAGVAAGLTGAVLAGG